MNEQKTDLTDRDKILKGMDKVYESLVKFKKSTNSDMIVLENNHIKRIKPQKI